MGTSRATMQKIFSRAMHLREGFEDRPQQLAMAVAVADALEEERHLLVEAPTGVGKSLAYLIPAALYAIRTGKPGLISTHTRNLQQQLLGNDIPLASALADQAFRATLLKGRRNYLCVSRLQQALEGPRTLFGEDARSDLSRILEWSRSTPDGDLDTLAFVPSPGIREAVCSEAGVCAADTCGPRCFHQRAWERARSADLVIINHALFFSLLALREADDASVLDQGFLILDEAHTIEAVAASALGARVGRRQILNAIQRLYNPRTRRGLLAPLRPKGLRALCSDLQHETEEFFDRARASTVHLRGNHETPGASPVRLLRIRQPHFVADTLSAPLEEFCVRIREMLEDAVPLLQRESEGALRTLTEAGAGISSFLDQPVPGNAYWIEVGEGRGAAIVLCAAPVEVGPLIGARLFHGGSTTVMTSATLSIDGSTEYFQERVGGAGVTSLLLDSPFDFGRSMTVALANGIAPPDDPAFPSALPLWIRSAVERSRGRALVLFTSTVLMRSCAGALKGDLEERGIRLLVQGEDRLRDELLEEFRRDIPSVLFGLDSFWTGVDVPGEALEHVVITRLPFAVPNHPLIEARMEAISRRGGNSFLEFTLPEAVLKFRQGIGRLIRSTEDRGLVTVLDSRILTKSYGSVFLRSIPRCPLEIWEKDGDSTPLDLRGDLS